MKRRTYGPKPGVQAAYDLLQVLPTSERIDLLALQLFLSQNFMRINRLVASELYVALRLVH
jgi:hypothetical protein